MREKTYGEKLVHKGFNPYGITSVDIVKHLYAKVIDELTDYHSTNCKTKNDKIQNRMLEIAAEKAIEAEMWAVKGLTFGRS